MNTQTTVSTVYSMPDTLALEAGTLSEASPVAPVSDVWSSVRYVYCLFCRTGREQMVANNLTDHGMECLIAYVSRIVVRDGKQTVEQRRLLPGYLFVETPFCLERFAFIVRNVPDVLRLLSYEHGECACRGADLAFYQRLKERRGVIDLSQVYQEGDRIHVVSGALKGFEGNIVAVNKKRKCVAISLGEGSLMNRIWCSVEYVERGDAAAGHI